MEESEQEELWQNEDICNIQTTEHPLKNLESLMASLSKQLAVNKPSIKNLRSAIKKVEQEKPVQKAKVVEKKPLTMQERYELSWKICYNKLNELRKKEVDSEQKSGTLGSKDRDKEFISQVAKLAESDEDLKF